MTGDSNGNVYSQILDAPGLPSVLTQAYSYDGVNRLGGVNETGGGTNWSRAYYYDPYGNRAAQGDGFGLSTPDCVTTDDPGCGTEDLDFDPANNRLKTAWADYDLAGNLITFKPSMYQWTASYDADNKQTAFCPGTTSACSGIAPGSKATYDYDGDGNRVRKIVNDTQKSLYVYDAFGNLAAEYADFQPTGPTGTQYRTTDHLGSTRIVTDASPTPQVLSRRDFFPFGEEIMASATYGNRHLVTDGTYNEPSGYRQQFTAKERDDESGLDYFLARYYSVGLGRFTSPDSPLVDQSVDDPQSWSLYTYVRNNPLQFIDPTGNDCVYVSSSGTGIDSIDNQGTSRQCGNTGGYWVDGTVTQARFAHGALILTGTTNGEDRTSASYGLGPDPGLMALQEAGSRARRDVTTFVIAEGVFATAYVSTYAGPALYTALIAGGEAGVLSLGKGFQLARNASGKVKGDIKDIRAAVYRMSPEQLKQAADELRQSIRVRSQELVRLGEEAQHRLRIGQERDLLRTIEKKLGEN